jgi:hypothetical protein
MCFRGGSRFAIHRDTSDHETRYDIVTLVVAKDKDPSARWRNRNMIDRGNPQLSSIGQVNSERHKRGRMNKLSNVGLHNANRLLPSRTAGKTKEVPNRTLPKTTSANPRWLPPPSPTVSATSAPADRSLPSSCEVALPIIADAACEKSLAEAAPRSSVSDATDAVHGYCPFGKRNPKPVMESMRFLLMMMSGA